MEVLLENIYHSNREERIQQAFELIVPELGTKTIGNRKQKIVSDIIDSQSAVKVKKAQ